jgi:hypothetical protein
MDVSSSFYFKPLKSFTYLNQVSYWSPVKPWLIARWTKKHVTYGNLMWNHSDEEWFRWRDMDYVSGSPDKGKQPKTAMSWKKHGTNKKFDPQYEKYCRIFLDASLLS